MSSGKKILIIDDEKTICETLHDFLEDEGYVPFVACDGSEGLDVLARESGIELIITDIMMPKKEGISTIRQVRQDYPSVKIIAMSGAAYYTNYLETAKFFGVNHILSKPVHLAELCKLVKEMLAE
jgi:DNA-binding response OmpR family regulator